jgi:hypothetical protein
MWGHFCFACTLPEREKTQQPYSLVIAHLALWQHAQDGRVISVNSGGEKMRMSVAGATGTIRQPLFTALQKYGAEEMIVDAFHWQSHGLIQ